VRQIPRFTLIFFILLLIGGCFHGEFDVSSRLPTVYPLVEGIYEEIGTTPPALAPVTIIGDGYDIVLPPSEDIPGRHISVKFMDPDKTGVFIVEVNDSQCCKGYMYYLATVSSKDSNSTVLTIKDGFRIPNELRTLLVQQPPSNIPTFNSGEMTNDERSVKFLREMARQLTGQNSEDSEKFKFRLVKKFEKQMASRIALVIGNSNYNALQPLNNAGNDAVAIALQLKALGIDVETHTNLAHSRSRRFPSRFA